jgi:hypothetical protein
MSNTHQPPGGRIAIEGEAYRQAEVFTSRQFRAHGRTLFGILLPLFGAGHHAAAKMVWGRYDFANVCLERHGSVQV